MLEIFLFVNPLGKICLEVEKKFMSFAQHQERKVVTHFIPTLNFSIISDYMQFKDLDPKNLDNRNHLFNVGYEIILDYKAAQFQGNIKARDLLMDLQTRFNTDFEYSPEIVADLLKKHHIDAAAFWEDRGRDELRLGFQSDQQIASQMDVTNTPSAVFVDTRQPDTDSAVMLDTVKDYQVFENVCQQIADNPELFYREAPKSPILRVL
ncbi:DsbA family protein [Lacticaseibacillus brantae]|uniref:DsbA family protein n=1 Tax=Lacticaseibacillus brantae TaxID=943673 RepID=UPI00070D590A|nr:DsbA family protein [Lacticaseibacillus brantae]